MTCVVCLAMSLYRVEQHGSSGQDAHRPAWFSTHCPLVDCDFDFKLVIFKCIVVIISISISSTTDFRWMVQDSADDKSTLVQVMAWCHQAPSHYLNQCWPRSLSPIGKLSCCSGLKSRSWNLVAQWHHRSQDLMDYNTEGMLCSHSSGNSIMVWCSSVIMI